MIINNVEESGWTRASGLKFDIANVRKPLAVAGQIVEAGDRVVLDPDPSKSFIENVTTKERLQVRKERGVYVFDAKLENGEVAAITLDSGAGASVWPEKKSVAGKLLPKDVGLEMIAANGTEIESKGQKVVKFKGREIEAADSGFTWRS